MKRLIAFITLLVFLVPNANAAVIAKPMVQLAQVDSAATGLVAFGSQVLTFGNHEKSGFAQLMNGPIVELTSGVESFVSAGAVDATGNFYLVGASSNPIVGTLPPISGVLNPDNVISDPVSSNKGDANNLIYWKLDNTGQLIDTQSMTMPAAVLPTSIIVDQYGITIAGTSWANPGNNGFVINWNSKPTYIGKNSTEVFNIVRDGSGVIAVGQSSEKLLTTTLKGKSDGFLAKVANEKLTSVQRSSEANTNRAWRTTSSNLLVGGYVNSQAVITKFNAKITPIFTDRYLSNGSAYTAAVGKFNYGAFVSLGAVKALPTWKTKKAILVLTFDAKGVITSANYVNSAQISGFAATSALGPIVLASGFLYRA